MASRNTEAQPRSRTPWDAGGYSLPINAATNGGISSQRQRHPEICHNYASIKTPPLSPKHKFCDSRSSLSSFISSLQSTATHSRYSSTSTFNSNSHTYHKSFGTDIVSPELRGTSQTVEEAKQTLSTDACQVDKTRQRTSLFPVSSLLDQLAFVAEIHSSTETSDTNDRDDHLEENAVSASAAKSTTKLAAYNRPGSPSDAFLITHTSAASLRVNAEVTNGYQQQ